MIQVSEKEILSTFTNEELGKLVMRKYYNQRKLEESKFTEYDTCLICGRQSPYTMETHIDKRIGYIEGAGQGCFQANRCDKI